MLTTIDHIVIATQEPAAVASRYRALLGLEPGAHDAESGRIRVRFQLGNAALDIAQLQAAGPAAQLNVLAIGFATPDLAKTRHRLERVGIDTSDGQSIRLVADKVDYEWPIATLSPAATHGPNLQVVEQNTAAASKSALECEPYEAVSGLDHVVITTSHPERAAALYGARLGLEMKLDRTNRDWGARLMFFKCGDSIVEIAQNLKNSDPNDADRIWGLSWRTADVAAANARMARAGFSVSELRAGRKPGTRVFTVRDAPAGIPTLVIGPERAN